MQAYFNYSMISRKKLHKITKYQTGEGVIAFSKSIISFTSTLSFDQHLYQKKKQFHDLISSMIGKFFLHSLQKTFFFNI